jgi:hypothetical protein
MRYNYKGFRGCDSRCDIEVQRRNDGKYVFIATEVPENRGTSISKLDERLEVGAAADVDHSHTNAGEGFSVMPIVAIHRI